MTEVAENVSLAAHSTMRLGGPARFYAEVFDEEGVIKAIAFARDRAVPVRVIGFGSNIVWGDKGFDGLVIANRIPGIAIDDTTVSVGAGVEWDECVEETVAHELSGLEFLSLIPGTTGAVPVQNVGAYGAEVRDTITIVRAYDMQKNAFVDITNDQCRFAYRASRFNGEDAGRFVITNVTFALSFDVPKPPFYRSLQQYLDDHGREEYSPRTIRDAVISIRRSKLPDPDVVPNCGSFFKNPVISADAWKHIESKYPDAPHWDVEGGVKLSAAWLLDKAGFKQFRDPDTGMATYDKQPLVLINDGASSTADLLAFKQKIVDATEKQFGITLVQEPEFIES